MLKFKLGLHKLKPIYPYFKIKKLELSLTHLVLLKPLKVRIHLIDSLLTHKIEIVKVFAPEHGFRSKADNGEDFGNSIDPKTQLPLISLHGKYKKPQPKDLEGLDLIVFDIQDVGVRFYTYLSSLHLVMESCAENNVQLLVLDRPNPNAHYVDGPLMEDEFKSFVGMHNVPIVYGLTLGEYATMINNEGWLKNNVRCELDVIPIKNYTHKTPYSLLVRPSPNLPNDRSINLYPSLCLLEQTPVSIGRGTEMQFQIYGHPDFKKGGFKFKPQPNFGAKYPKQKGLLCYGTDLRNQSRLDRVEINWLIDSYKMIQNKEAFFFDSFARIAGTKTLQQQITKGASEEEIRASWKPQIDTYLKIRSKYLLYDD